MARSSKKERADLLVFAQGLAESREKARVLIAAGKIFAGEKRVEKPGDLLSNDAALTLRGEKLPFVSRGGSKLEGALTAMQVDVQGLVVADFGASTGGFTDCVLARGAKRVYAIDVGYGQLHEKLRQDARVVSLERTNARHLSESSLPEKVDLVVIDASFIGVAKLLPAACMVTQAAGQVVAMVKPQFEAGRAHLKDGVVTDEGVRQGTIDAVIASAAALGLTCVARADSVLKGPEGNQETFILLRKQSPGVG